jgi:hypothetical protein
MGRFRITGELNRISAFVLGSLVPGVGVELALRLKDPMFIGVAASPRRSIGTEWYCSTAS